MSEVMYQLLIFVSEVGKDYEPEMPSLWKDLPRPGDNKPPSELGITGNVTGQF